MGLGVFGCNVDQLPLFVYMIEQLEPSEAPAADGGGGGTTILANMPLTFSYMSPVFFAVESTTHDGGK